MARQFFNETLTVAAGALADSTRAQTLFVVIRPYDGVFESLSTDTDIVHGMAGTSASWSLFTASQQVFADGDFGSGGPQLSDKDTWYVTGVTKASGSAAYRYHVRPIGGTWTHVDSGTTADGPGGTDSVLFGQGPTRNNGKFQIAAAAVFAGAMSDQDIESALTDDMADWMAAQPLAAWQFNQATVGDDVTDLTGGGADQTAISGTTVVGDPAGWTYFAGGPAEVTGTAATTAAFTAIAAGTRIVAGSAVGSATLTATAAGTPQVPGKASTAIGYTATAAGLRTVKGTAALAISFTSGTTVPTGAVTLRATAHPAATFRSLARPRVTMEVGHA